jgi:hypothetical protein
MNLNYTVNGGPAYTDPLVSLSFASGADYNFTHSIGWAPGSSGTYTVKFWCNNLNGGNADQNNANDTLTATFIVVDTVATKQVMIELFTQASCGYCLMEGPHADTGIQKATLNHTCNAVRYHTDWPGLDYMNQEIQWTFIGSRVSYYNEIMVPDCKIDGIDDADIYVVEYNDIKAAQPIGSPFKINIDTFNYNPLTQTYRAHVTIKSFGYFAAGFQARAVLTVDTIKYDSDQSTETPISAFAPPIGTGTYGDSLYPDVFNFPTVAEDMLPSESGTTLGAFTPESTQTLSLSWTKDHPWGANPKVDKYDSLCPGVHLTVFIQTDAQFYSQPAHYVFQSASDAAVNYVNTTGVNNVNEDISNLKLYPNPASTKTNLTFTLTESENVNVSVYNVLGENIFSVDKGMMNAGQQTVVINSSGFTPGVYILRMNTGNSTTTQRLVIER